MRRHIQSCRRNRRRSEVTKTASTLRPWVWCKTVQPYFVITYFHSWSSFAKISLSEIKLKLAFIKLKFLHDVTVAILVFLNDETAVMLMFQASLVEIKLSCKLFLLFSWIYIRRCRLREWKRCTGIPKKNTGSQRLAKKDRGRRRSFGRAKNGTRAKKWTKGEGGSFLPLIPTPSQLFYSPHFSRGLWLLFLVLCPETPRKLLLCRLPKTMKWWPCCYPRPILWELNHFLM